MISHQNMSRILLKNGRKVMIAEVYCSFLSSLLLMFKNTTFLIVLGDGRKDPAFVKCLLDARSLKFIISI